MDRPRGCEFSGPEGVEDLVDHPGGESSNLDETATGFSKGYPLVMTNIITDNHHLVAG